MPESIAHPGGQLRESLTGHGRGGRLEPQLAPVRVLPRGQHGGQRIAVPAGRVVDLGGADVVDRQDEVVAAEFAFAFQELLDFGAAVGLRKKPGVMTTSSRPDSTCSPVVT